MERKINVKCSDNVVVKVDRNFISLCLNIQRKKGSATQTSLSSEILLKFLDIY